MWLCGLLWGCIEVAVLLLRLLLRIVTVFSVFSCSSGTCACKTGVYGPKCDDCHPGFFHFSNTGCQPCQCNGHSTYCHPQSGETSYISTYCHPQSGETSYISTYSCLTEPEGSTGMRAPWNISTPSINKPE
uniref:Laminin EGF-like domain-containing protein n=1 Tax=Electrophorus electricus TaxID=8005 RepID=A0A4W4FFF6_ELEEL